MLLNSDFYFLLVCPIYNISTSLQSIWQIPDCNFDVKQYFCTSHRVRYIFDINTENFYIRMTYR